MKREELTKDGQQRIDEKHAIRILPLGNGTFRPQIYKHTNGDGLPDEEPRILFRGRDRLAIPMLRHYRELCVKDGANDFQLDSIDKMIAEFEDFASWSGTMKQPGVTRGA